MIYPDKSTFGTIAHTSLRPDNKAGVDLFGSIGTFGIWNEGFAVHSGRMDGILETGGDAPRMILRYSSLQTKGFVDHTPTTYGNPFIFAPNGQPGFVAVGGGNPFRQTIADFGEQGAYGSGNTNYDPIDYPYNPDQTKDCPAATTAQFAVANASRTATIRAIRKLTATAIPCGRG